MRLLTIVAGSLLVTACATAPRPATTTPEIPSSAHTRGEIIGLTADQLFQRFGTPALQVREGTSLKLQFRGAGCVLDAYLYPQAAANAPYRVIYVDTRNRAMVDVDQASCVTSLESS